MRQTRMIRISFLICAAAAIIAFWTGFYFGETGNEPEQILTASGESAAGAGAGAASDRMEQTAEDDGAAGAGAGGETVESMKGIRAEEQYYLKESGEYLTVFHSDTDAAYFETDLKLSDLPEDVRADAREGIPFDNLEELYDFLESYSS